MTSQLGNSIWDHKISNRRQKERAALTVTKRLKDGDVVGVGSGSTSFVTLQTLAKQRDQQGLSFQAIPTSIEMELACANLNIPTTSLQVKKPDWSFDGADEVDPKGNLIKGRGGALLREKMLIKACPEVYIVIDASKQVDRLGRKFPVPVEIHPPALQIVDEALHKLKDVEQISLRLAGGKDGPVITEYGNLILDVTFNHISPDTEGLIKQIVGVVESGLFIGYKPHIVVSN